MSPQFAGCKSPKFQFEEANSEFLGKYKNSEYKSDAENRIGGID
jgi:hypothetical protein